MPEIHNIKNSCWSCRQETKDADQICPHCGAAVNLTSARRWRQSPPPATNIENDYLKHPFEFDADASFPMRLKPRKRVRIASIIIVLLLSFGGIFFVARDNLPTAPSITLTSQPKLKVWWTKDDENGQRLHFLSRDERDFVVTDVVVNNKRECAPLLNQDLSLEKSAEALHKNKLSPNSNIDGLKRYYQGVENLTLAMVKTQLPPPPWTFRLGDEHETIFACHPVMVYVQTSLGNLRFTMRDDE